MLYAVIAVIVVVIAVGVIWTAKRNSEIKRSGIETNAVVTRIRENTSTDEDGYVSYSYTFYVTYRTQAGQTVEAQLASGKSFDIRIGKRSGIGTFMKGAACVSNTSRKNRIM